MTDNLILIATFSLYCIENKLWKKTVDKLNTESFLLTLKTAAGKTISL